MKIIAITAALLFALALWISSIKRKDGSADVRWPVKAKRPLGDRERIAYFSLRLAVPEYIVLAQVALSQFVSVTGKNNQAIRNKTYPLVADFVVCDKSFQVIAVIELDGRSHDHPRRQRADRNKNRALSDAGLKFLRWNASALPSKDEMRAAILPQPVTA